MTTAELERIARDLIPPVGSSVAIGMVDHVPGERAGTGTTTYRAGFLVDGRRRVPAGPGFERQRDMLRLVHLLNGDSPTSRAERPDLARGDGMGASAADRRDADAQPEAPDAQAGPLACAGCGGPIPPGRRGQRRTTCSDRCRQAMRRSGMDRVHLSAEAAAASANERASRYGVDGRLTTRDVLALWERQPECVTCGRGRGVDHVTPMSVGGPNTPNNLQTLCRACNTAKGRAERLTPGASAAMRQRVASSAAVTPSTPSRPS